MEYNIEQQCHFGHRPTGKLNDKTEAFWKQCEPLRPKTKIGVKSWTRPC